MSLQSRLSDLISAIGADIKAIKFELDIRGYRIVDLASAGSYLPSLSSVSGSNIVVNATSIDGRAMVANEYVLLKDWTTADGGGDPVRNGVYRVTAINAPTTGQTTLARAVEFDTWTEFVAKPIFVKRGAINSGSLWTAYTPSGTGVLGTDAISFRKIGPDPSYSARVQRESDQSIPNNNAAGDAVSFTVARHDTGGFWSPTNPTRLTVPEVGYYVVTGNVQWAPNSNFERLVSARKTANIGGVQTTVARTRGPANNVAAAWTGQNFVSGPVLCQPGDYFEMTVYQTSGGALSLIYYADYGNVFSIQRVS